MPYKDATKRRLAAAESAKRSRDRLRQERASAAFSVDPAENAVDPVDPAIGPLLPARIRLRDMADVVAILETAAQAVADDRGATPIEKARVFALVANAALRAVEAAIYAPRIAALEAAINPTRHLRSLP